MTKHKEADIKGVVVLSDAPAAPADGRKSYLARQSRDNLTRAVFLLAWPVIVEMALQSTVGIADVAMVGRLGPAAIAAIGLGNQIYMLALTVFAAVRTGTTVLIARLTGAGDRIGANRAARQSLLLATYISVLIMILGLLFPAAGLRMLGAGPDVIEVGVGYMRWKAVSAVFAIILMTCTGILRGSGDTLTSMYANTTVNVLNIALNWVFIFGNLGMPAMGASGAGFSTMLARAVGAAIMLAVLLRGSTGVRLKVWDDNRPHFETIRRVLGVGLPAAMEQLFLRGAQVFFTMILTGMGTNIYAAHQIALRADSVAFMPGMGFAVAATTLVGQNLGANQPGVARRAGFLTIYMCVAMMSAIGVLLFLFAVPIVGFFTTEPEVIVEGARVMRIMAFAMPFMATARVAAGALRGAGDTKYVMWGTGVSIWVARLGLAYVFVQVFGRGLPGAWMAMFADHIARALIFGVRYYQGRWQHIEV